MKAKRIGKAVCAALAVVMTVALLSPCAALASDVTLPCAASRTWVNRNSNIDDELIQKFMDETGIQIDLQVIPTTSIRT